VGFYARGAEAGSGVEAERQMSNDPFIVFVGTETQFPWLRAYDDIMIDHELVSRLPYMAAMADRSRLKGSSRIPAHTP
jgi:hypothetical protein